MIILTKQEITCYLETRCLSPPVIDALSCSFQFAIILCTTSYAVLSAKLEKNSISFIRMQNLLLVRGVKVSVDSQNYNRMVSIFFYLNTYSILVFFNIHTQMCGARLAQSVEHETLNLRVVGSSPTLGIDYFSWNIC